MAGRAGLASVQVCVFILIALLVFRIDLGTSPAGLAALVASFVLCAAALSLLCGSVLKTEDSASGVGIVVTLIMSALGGCWWPSEVMPAWMRATAKLFPTSWAMNGLHQLLSWGGGLREVLPHIGVLSLMAVVSWWLAARQLRQVA
jgi:ABC-2 type transport system permease protein